MPAASETFPANGSKHTAVTRNNATSASQTDDQSHNGHLLGAGDIRRIAAEAGISPTKKFGQNFVIDPGTVRRIVREAGVTAQTRVLEVGPGLGSLTLALLETGAAVTAVEIDPALAKRLPETIAEFMPEASDRLTVINADAMSLSPGTLPKFAPDYVPKNHNNNDLPTVIATNSSTENVNNNASESADAQANTNTNANATHNDQSASTTTEQAGSASTTNDESTSDHAHSADNNNPFTLVSNLPYNVATPILLTLLERFENLDHFLVMVQKEVADRLAAKPGSKTYGTPSVKLAWYGQAERVGLVGRNVFWPAPNVDSALVSFTRYADNDDNAATPHNVEENSGSRKSDEPGNENPQSKSILSQPVSSKPISPIPAKANREKVFQLIDAAFGQRRKTLHAALKKLVPAETFEAAGIDPTRRGETLTIEEFAALAEAVES
ncbi:rRNA adenine dimethyltransferase family protein [Bifidobacterium sp. ESL0745]|uniref:ribosomal RNA small subunit methyltransferase A n=1 Tax=Bifidobacterium sp. ESL0745 TaxID=2983226 RepID=UPI0023FA063B|nr:rRNA adenine dimethyltransferase family protein [Bifidobacterium sp. ESL0745]MDF7666021.1 rRNA adenine dimethyltransferase family protein [Bifidobacterium sp. ESL0745]